jgi:hypothetical protein
MLGGTGCLLVTQFRDREEAEKERREGRKVPL